MKIFTVLILLVACICSAAGVVAEATRPGIIAERVRLRHLERHLERRIIRKAALRQPMVLVKRAPIPKTRVVYVEVKPVIIHEEVCRRPIVKRITIIEAIPEVTPAPVAAAIPVTSETTTPTTPASVTTTPTSVTTTPTPVTTTPTPVTTTPATVAPLTPSPGLVAHAATQGLSLDYLESLPPDELAALQAAYDAGAV